MGQLGMDAAQIGELEHWFSCKSTDGSCRELVETYVARIDAHIPPLHLHKTEDANWVFFGEVFGDIAEESLVFHMEDDYRSSMIRRLRAGTVREEAVLAFGDG